MDHDRKSEQVIELEKNSGSERSGDHEHAAWSHREFLSNSTGLAVASAIGGLAVSRLLSAHELRVPVRKLATTNPIESCLSTVQRVARNVKRWREGNQRRRWTATGLWEAEKKFRRIKGYQEIPLLKERLNPSRIQQKEVRTVEVA